MAERSTLVGRGLAFEGGPTRSPTYTRDPSAGAFDIPPDEAPATSEKKKGKTRMLGGEKERLKQAGWKWGGGMLRGPTTYSSSGLGLGVGRDFESAGGGGSIFGMGLAPWELKKKIAKTQKDPTFEGGKWAKFLPKSGGGGMGEGGEAAGGALGAATEAMEGGAEGFTEGVDKLAEAGKEIGEAAKTSGQDIASLGEALKTDRMEQTETIKFMVGELKDVMIRVANELKTLKSAVSAASSAAKGGM